MYIVLAALAVGGVVWISTLTSSSGASTENPVISPSGIHWHPHLSIIIKGETVPIPPGIGLSGTVHNPIHTHDPDGTIHLEFERRVTEKDTALKKFFDVWGKDFSQHSLLGNTTGEGGTVTMTVNGKENFEFENYHMKDGDKIELTFK